MSLKTADDVYVKDEPCSDLPNEYEPASALAANTWQDVKAEWDSETCDESDVAPTPRLYTECDEDERAQSLVDLVKAEEQSESVCLSEDEGQYIKEELELGPTVFLRPRVTLVCQESSQDNGTKKPDTESVSSGVLGHQKTRDEASPYKCGYCTYTTRYKINYTRHERQHIHEKKSMSEGTLHTEHANEKTQANYKEQKLTSARKGDLIRNMKIHTEGKPFKCTLCSYSCARKCDLNRHERFHTGHKPYKCTHCTYSCAQKYDLKLHERIHTKDKPFKCTHCSYSCARQSDLNRHERIHTGYKPYKCAYCTFSCAQKNYLKLHERIHTKDKPFKCTHCSYSCACKTRLKEHERIHTGDKPYKCAYCNYSCAHKRYLKIHERFHTEDKPFKCTHCSYSCARKSSLKEHERIHTGDKPYKCAYCNYSCAQKRNLKIHERIHTGDKPYKCVYCTYSSARKYDLICHERIHTEDKPFKWDPVTLITYGNIHSKAKSCQRPLPR